MLDFHCGLASISLVPFWSPFSSFPSSPCLFSCFPSPSSVLLILEIFLIGAKILFDFHCVVDSAVCHSGFHVLLSSLPYVLYWFSSSLLSSFFLFPRSFFLSCFTTVFHIRGSVMFLLFSRRAELAGFVWPICFRH